MCTRRTCKAVYYPDRITRPVPRLPHQNGRLRRIQVLEYAPEYLSVSKHGVWVEAQFAWMQESAVHHLRSSWQQFTKFVNQAHTRNGGKSTTPLITIRQSKKLYSEHFARRLLLAHGAGATFTSPAHASPEVLVDAVLSVVGRNGGVVPGARTHSCADCTHPKRFTSDDAAQPMRPSDAVADMEGVRVFIPCIYALD